MDWTDSLFDQLAVGSGMSDKTKEACRRVLVPHALPTGSVGVEKGVDVARELGMFPQAISRAVSDLRKRLLEEADISVERFQVGQVALRTERDDSRDMAVVQARKLYGENLEVRDAQRGQTYIGKPLLKTPLHVVQSVGPGQAVIHEVSKLARVPNMTLPLMEVRYPARGGQAEVQEYAPGQERGGRSR